MKTANSPFPTEIASAMACNTSPKPLGIPLTALAPHPKVVQGYLDAWRLSAVCSPPFGACSWPRRGREGKGADRVAARAPKETLGARHCSSLGGGYPVKRSSLAPHADDAGGGSQGTHPHPLALPTPCWIFSGCPPVHPTRRGGYSLPWGGGSRRYPHALALLGAIFCLAVIPLCPITGGGGSQRTLGTPLLPSSPLDLGPVTPRTLTCLLAPAQGGGGPERCLAHG